MKENLDIKSVDYELTGGGVFTYWGQLSEEKWFSYCLDTLYFYDDNIDKVLKKYLANEDELDYDEDFDMYEWEEKHTIWKYERKFKKGDDDKEQYVVDFLESMFEALIKKYPKAKELMDLRCKEIGFIKIEQEDFV